MCAAVTYIPEKMVARPGEKVTVYCVFNDHSTNASSAMWMLNFQQTLHRSQYHAVSQRVREKTPPGHVESKRRLIDLTFSLHQPGESGDAASLRDSDV